MNAPTTLVLLHGGGLGPWSWDHVRRHLPADVVVHTPVLPGHRGHADTVFTTDGAVRQVGALVADAPGPVVLAGLSLGAQTALLAAQAGVRADALVLSGVNVRGIPGLRAAGPLLGPLVGLSRRPFLVSRTAAAMGVPEDLRAQHLADAQALTGDQLAAVLRASAGVRLGAAALPPCLVLHGSREAGLIRRSAQDLAARGAVVEVVEGGSHTWPLTRPERFAAAVSSTLQDRAATSG